MRESSDKPRRDLGFLAPAAGAWMLCWWGVTASSAHVMWSVVLLALTAGAGGVLLRWLQRERISSRVRSLGRWVLLAMCGASIAAVSGAWQLAQHEDASLAEIPERTQCSAVGTLQQDPRALRDAALGAEKFVITLHSVQARCRVAGQERSFDAQRVRVFGDSPRWGDLLPGQKLRVKGHASPATAERDRATWTQALLSTREAPQLLKEPPWYQRAAGVLRHKLRDAARPIPAAELVPALSIGDESLLSQELIDQMRSTGLGHLSAVSGANVAVILTAFVFLLRACRVPPAWVAVCGVLAVIGFVVIARPQPSVLRAAVMACIGLFALATGRPRVSLSVLGVASLALLVWDPRLSHSAGFALSVAATGAMVWFCGPWGEYLRRKGVNRYISDIAVATLAAQLGVTPILILLGEGVGVIAVFANLAAGVAAAPVMIGGLCAAVLALVWLPAAQLIVWCAALPAWWIATVSRIGSEMPLAHLDLPAHPLSAVGALLVALGCVALVRRGYGYPLLAVVVCGVILLTALPYLGRAVSEWNVIVCDVGQGDAVLMRAGDQRAVVVDAGPEPGAVDACLQQQGITDVPLLILTHLHRDHVGGVEGVARSRDVQQILISEGQPTQAVTELSEFAQQHAAELNTVDTALSLHVGDARLEVFTPTADGRALQATHSDANNNSLLVRYTVEGVRVLLTGDVELEAQRALLSRDADLRADVLKLPHHGSRYTDTRFLEAVHASAGLVSVGADNRYGHPSAGVLSEMEKLGAQMFRTDRHGTCAVAIQNERFGVQCER